MVDIEAAWKIYTSNPDYVAMSKRAFAEVITSYEAARTPMPEASEVDADDVCQLCDGEGVLFDALANAMGGHGYSNCTRCYRPEPPKAAIAATRPAAVDENKLQATIATIIIKNQQITKRKHSKGVLVHGQLAAATEIINAIRPYLRDTKPVINIDAGAKAICDVHQGAGTFDSLSENAKARAEQWWWKAAAACAKAWGLTIQETGDV